VTRWRQILGWSALGTLLAAALMAGIVAKGDGIAELLSPGDRGPWAAVIHDDFPHLQPHPGLGHDGQQFYVIARNPLHPKEVAPELDRPRYRLQRIGMPLLAWLIHPSGGGPGLVGAMLAVGLASLFAAGAAVGALATQHGLRPIYALLGPLLPGSLVAVRLSTADALALAAAVGAIALAERRQVLPAALCACIAVLSREALLVTLVAYLLHRRDRVATIPVVSALAVVAGWWLYLHQAVADASRGVDELTAPLSGFRRAIIDGPHGADLGGLLLVGVAVALGVTAMARCGLRSLWTPLVAANLAFLAILDLDVVGPWANSIRVSGPLLLFSVLGVATTARGDTSTPPGASPA
jgi:hypothetical protein